MSRLELAVLIAIAILLLLLAVLAFVIALQLKKLVNKETTVHVSMPGNRDLELMYGAIADAAGKGTFNGMLGALQRSGVMGVAYALLESWNRSAQPAQPQQPTEPDDGRTAAERAGFTHGGAPIQVVPGGEPLPTRVRGDGYAASAGGEERYEQPGGVTHQDPGVPGGSWNGFSARVAPVNGSGVPADDAGLLVYQQTRLAEQPGELTQPIGGTNERRG